MSRRRTPRGGRALGTGTNVLPSRKVKDRCAACKQKRQDNLDNLLSPPTSASLLEPGVVGNPGGAKPREKKCPVCGRWPEVWEHDRYLTPATTAEIEAGAS